MPPSQPKKQPVRNTTMRRLITFRNLTIANHLLPAIAYDDCSGLEDGDIDQLNNFLSDLDAEVNTFCNSLNPERYDYNLAIDDREEDDFRRCDVTKLRALCSPVTVLVTTHGGAAPDANLYDYTSFVN